jgi:transcriptional regulator with XRE-family HTH domain
MLSLPDKIDLALLSQGIILEVTDDEKDSTRFIHSNTVDRRALKDAMKNAGHTVSSLAQDTGVEPSMISRMLREPKNSDPDESARNPSIALAAKVSSALATSAEGLFPDIFDTARTDLKGKKDRKRQRKTRKHLQSRSSSEYQDGT